MSLHNFRVLFDEVERNLKYVKNTTEYYYPSALTELVFSVSQINAYFETLYLLFRAFSLASMSDRNPLRKIFLFVMACAEKKIFILLRNTHINQITESLRSMCNCPQHETDRFPCLQRAVAI